jgi:hypothetical protein
MTYHEPTWLSEVQACLGAVRQRLPSPSTFYTQVTHLYGSYPSIPRKGIDGGDGPATAEGCRLLAEWKRPRLPDA